MSQEKEYTGGSVSYYSIDVNDPINENSDPYTAECQDIIEALKLDFQEGNVLKAIWRRAAARLGRSKKGYDDGLYDAEKIVFYGQRLVAAEQRAKRHSEKPFGEKLIEACEQVNGQIAAESADWIEHNRTARSPVAADTMVEVLYDNSAWSVWRAGDIDWLKVWRYRLAFPSARLEVDAADPYGPRDAEGWYAWNGDETMRPAGKVDFVTREGSMYCCGQAQEEDWTHNRGPLDIVKWRPAR